MRVDDLNQNVTMDNVNGIVPSISTDIDGIIVEPKKCKKKALESEILLYCCYFLITIIFLFVSFQR